MGHSFWPYDRQSVSPSGLWSPPTAPPPTRTKPFLGGLNRLRYPFRTRLRDGRGRDFYVLTVTNFRDDSILHVDGKMVYACCGNGMPLASRRSVETREEERASQHTRPISLKFPSGICGPLSNAPIRTWARVAAAGGADAIRG